ncbi:9220_t:CDS:10 [Funneliformis geosporum]|uniref:9220_t:CDS:1 n=1 Tax=Funneliformis geosporum TaxID=1117311 RepID=A0A9W4WR09_9GLOM|nr:9220_t:CDS:10 [Funneliformis geosporum]
MSSENSTKDKGQNRFYISISQDGKYAVTFDAATLQFKVLKNTDHREFITYKKKNEDESSEQDNSHIEISHEDTSKEQKENKSSEINETISHFKIKDNFSIEVFHNIPPSFQSDARAKDRWSIDISNIVKCDDESFIFIAASKIENKYMNNTENSTRNENIRMIVKNHNGEDVFINIYPETTTDFGTAIYCLKLNDGAENSYNKLEIIQYNYNRLSGICRFVEDIDKDPEGKQEFENYVESYYVLKKFILLNYNGIYSFKYNKDDKNFSDNNVERFKRPENVMNEFKDSQDCMDQLLSHIYKKYFVYEDDDKKVLEVYDLGEMKLETSIKIREDDQKNDDRCIRVYSIDKQKLQFCFAQGPQSIGLFLTEHGSKIASKTFEKINIHLIEFINSDEKLLLIGSDSENDDDIKIIIWDMYDTDKVEVMPLEELTAHNLSSCFAIPVGEPEPWVTKKYEKNSFYLCYNDSEALQLIVGMSTIQIWHQFHDKTEKKKNLPNEGRPFLEFIWTNGIPDNQENEEHKLRITNVRFGLKYFRLEVYWYEKDTNKLNEGESNYDENSMNKEKITEKKMTQKMENMDKIDGMILRKKIIKWSDINESMNGIRYACEALEFLNVRTKSFTSYDKIQKNNEMVRYIYHIISRFAAKRPQRYRLLDVRYHVMKNLILGDCDHLIHYLLFGSGMDIYIPKCKFWIEERKCIIIDEDNPVDIKIDNEKRPGVLKEELEYPTTDVNLAIYNCRDRELNDTIIVTYILEYYYLFYAEDFANLLKTVSDAYSLCKILNYDTYTSLLKNEWQTFVKVPPKDQNPKKDSWIWLKIEPIISKFKSPKNDPKGTRFAKGENENGYKLIILHILLFLFIPRWYKANQDKSKLIKIITTEDNDDIFDLPVIEYIIYNYWSTIYLFATEILQLFHHGSIKYLKIIFNWFDLLSILLPVAVMTKLLFYTFKISNGFGSIQVIDSQLIVEISYSIFIIWIEFVNSTMSGNATNLATNETLQVILKSDFEPTDQNDNPFYFFPTSLIATYFWNNGDLVQREQFSSWSVEIFTIIASILLVIVLQNMLIAIMGNVYESAAAKSNQAVLKYKAIQISDYDDLQYRFDFWYQDPEFIPSKKRIRNFKNAIYLNDQISEFAKQLDYDQHSIWQFVKEG